MSKTFLYIYFSNDNPIYVGQTESLCRRNYEHKEDIWWNKNLSLEFCCVDSKDADYIEGYYIEHFKTYGIEQGGIGFNIKRPGKNGNYSTLFGVKEAHHRKWIEYPKHIITDTINLMDYKEYLPTHETNSVDDGEAVYLMLQDIRENKEKYNNTWK